MGIAVKALRVPRRLLVSFGQVETKDRDLDFFVFLPVVTEPRPLSFSVECDEGLMVWCGVVSSIAFKGAAISLPSAK